MAPSERDALVAENAALREELRQVRSRFDAIAAHGVSPVAIRDLEGRYLFVNAAAAALARSTPDRYLGRTDAELFGAEIGQRVRESDAQVIASRQPVNYRFNQDYEGRWLDYIVTKWPWVGVDGRVAGVIVHSHDVSDVSAASREAAELAVALRALLESIPDVVLVHRDGVVLHSNPAANRLLRGGDSVEGSTLSTLFGIDPNALSRLLVGTPAGGTVDLALALPGGRVDLDVRDVPAPWFGEPARVLIGRDMGERRRMEARLAAADRLAALGTLASGVAHELRNPLTYVMARVEQLAEQGGADAPALRDLGEAAERMAKILGDLSAYSRTVGPHAEFVDVEAELDRALTLARGRLRASVAVERERGDPPPVAAAGGRLCQVFLNLIVNAAQAAEEGGETAVVRIATFRAGDQVGIRVRDSGAGVPHQLRARIFEPFVTTKTEGEGTGLGLWVSQGIVGSIGGRIELENAGERGASFVVWLPVARRVEERAEPTAAVAIPAPSPPAARPRLLVVDDEPLIGDLLATGLRDSWEVELCGGVEDARVRLQATPVPDAILCDLLMPAGGGMAVQAARAALCGEVPILFMSGGAATPEARSFLADHRIEPIAKPFRIADIRRRLAALPRAASTTGTTPQNPSQAG
jgi:signal transduction histidine kinase/ActR/RegA family two-component response regulator